jgi:hypothetical protein
MIRSLALAAAVLALSACQADQTTRDLDKLGQDYQQQSEQSASPQNPDQATRADICGASHYRDLLGKSVSQIDRDGLPPHARIIRPGEMVTQDFMPERLNIRVGPDGKVASLQCF